MKLPNGYGSVYKLSGNRRNPWVACVTIGYNKETRNQERRVIGYFPNKPKALNSSASFALTVRPSNPRHLPCVRFFFRNS